MPVGEAQSTSPAGVGSRPPQLESPAALVDATAALEAGYGAALGLCPRIADLDERGFGGWVPWCLDSCGNMPQLGSSNAACMDVQPAGAAADALSDMTEDDSSPSSMVRRSCWWYFSRDHSSQPLLLPAFRAKHGNCSSASLSCARSPNRSAVHFCRTHRTRRCLVRLWQRRSRLSLQSRLLSHRQSG